MKSSRFTLPASARSLIVRAYLRRLAAIDRPIVIGPWRSELGFEQLYWLPFLNWALKRYKINPDRCIALTRGGLGALYPAKQSVDLFTLRTVDQVRLENQVDYEQRKILKQTSVTAWDTLVAQEAVERYHGKGQRFHLLHPSWMYWLFDPTWNENATLKHVVRHCDFSPPPVPDLPKGFELPKRFVAVRFYERHTFPLHPQVVGLAREIVQGIASKYPVVLLNQQLFTDDHVDLPLTGQNIFALPKVDPVDNLLLQAAVLARSQAFVGTYGGVAQWALLYRKPSLSFYTHFGGTLQAHRTLSNMLAAQTNVPFECSDLRAMKLWSAALGPVTIEEPEHEGVGA